MKLIKRDCGIKISLCPTGAMYLQIDFDFYGTRFSFNPSSAMAGQFGELVSALYSLYYEDGDGHNEWRNSKSISDDSHYIQGMRATVSWDNEGTIMDFSMFRSWLHDKDSDDIISISITTDGDEEAFSFSADVNGRDFCYAVAKACTDALKQYGVYGYRYSTEYDTFDLHRLLFIKAYALNCPEARELADADEHGFVMKTDFNKEVELLLFDM